MQDDLHKLQPFIQFKQLSSNYNTRYMHATTAAKTLELYSFLSFSNWVIAVFRSLIIIIVIAVGGKEEAAVEEDMRSRMRT